MWADSAIPLDKDALMLTKPLFVDLNQFGAKFYTINGIIVCKIIFAYIVAPVRWTGEVAGGNVALVERVRRRAEEGWKAV